MRRIVLASQKGGTSKTTTATCLAVGLARRGKRVLLVDCDAQSNATWTLMRDQPAEPPTLASVLMRQADAEDAIRATVVPNLDLLPADSALNGVNVALVQELGRDTRLRSALAPLDGRWDFVILDTAPTVTTILANALVYALEVIVPVDPGVYAMLGLVQLQATIEEVREAYGNQALHLAGLVLTKVARNNVSRDVEDELRSRFGDRVFRTTIPLSAKIEEAHTRGQTVMEYAPKSSGAVAYGGLVDEVLSYGRAKSRRRASSIGGTGTVDAA
ncbi:MAG TPA: ParA family protein [Isosphaeraceae bacterium]|nr:ParA family protein [Isosphaeraceae bacterium]